MGYRELPIALRILGWGGCVLMYYQGVGRCFQRKKVIKRKKNCPIHFKELGRESSKIPHRERILKNFQVPYPCRIFQGKS